PTKATIQLRLTKAEKGGDVGHTDWIAEGMAIQEAQILLKAQIKKAGKRPTVADATAIESRRNRLQNRIDAFQEQSSRHFPEDLQALNFVEETYDATLDSVDFADPNVELDPEEFNNANSTPAYVPPERQPLHLPSAVIIAQPSPLLTTLRAKEYQLRLGQINDALKNMRLGIAHRAFLYRKTVRPTRGYTGVTRAHRLVQNVSQSVSKDARIYNAAFAAMKRAACPEDASVVSLYRPVRTADLKADTAALDFNQPGNRNTSLSWIWSVNHGDDSPDEMVEAMISVARVSFLRAWARLERWKEEEVLVSNEVDWVRRFFQFQQNTWRVRASGIGTDGQRAYAAREAAMWEGLTDQAADTLARLQPIRARIHQVFAIQHGGTTEAAGVSSNSPAALSQPEVDTTQPETRIPQPPSL
ncbi:hypothetical protein BXZ70DRAFT_900016, partial [Cristinia sonorae]